MVLYRIRLKRNDKIISHHVLDSNPVTAWLSMFAAVLQLLMSVQTGEGYEKFEESKSRNNLVPKHQS